MANIEQIKKFWSETGVSLAEAKKALEQANGDEAQAKELLKTWGKKLSDKKADRETKSGMVESYVHSNGKTGVLVDVRCETDFVAKSPEFKTLVHELALHIAAMKPLYVSADTIPESVVAEEKAKYEAEALASGKSAEIAAQMVSGKIKKFTEEFSLMTQPWVKDDTKTITNLIEDTVSKVGERILVKQFARFEI